MGFRVRQRPAVSLSYCEGEHAIRRRILPESSLGGWLHIAMDDAAVVGGFDRFGDVALHVEP